MGGKLGSVDRAKMKAKEILENHQPNPLPEKADKELAKILAEAERIKIPS
jgi:hypothetical protein